jgi:pimeloyl-ACP methyl ester carboxylesterase
MAHLNRHTAPTQYVEAKGTRFAYRRFGNRAGVPLLMNIHFTGTVDHWEPAVTDGLAAGREFILFNNAGISSSSGSIPESVEEMAADAATFIRALGPEPVDVLCFSMGRLIAQTPAIAEPDLVRRVILAGTGPRSGAGMATLTPEAQEIFDAAYGEPDHLWLRVHFSPTETSQATGRAFLERLGRGTESRDPAANEAVAPGQLAAFAKWNAPQDNPYAYLLVLSQPTLVVKGDSDVITYTINSLILRQHISNARLIIYPDANHGSLYQHPERFMEDVSTFPS